MKDLHDSPPPYATVVFDCDSTLSGVEGIDELAAEHKPEIAALTERAMNGELALEEVYAARLDLIRPTRADVERVAAEYERQAVPNAAALICALRASGKRVVIVSGGLLPAVLPFALALGCEQRDVQAVDVQFDASGAYRGFDSASPLARSGGKPPILAALASETSPGSLAFIGDGMTDLEAAGEVQRFIAFGGVVRREAVFEAAAVHCAACDFAALVPLLFDAQELEALATQPDHAALMSAAQPYLS